MRQVVGMLMVLGAVGTGCKKEAAGAAAAPAAVVAPGAAEKKTAETAPAQEVDERAQRTAKINPIVECVNRTYNRAFEVRKAYLAWAGEKGPDGKRFSANLPELVVPKDCTDLDKILAGPPSLPALDGAAKAYVTALRDLDAIARPLTTYYAQNGFEDDKWARGKAEHPKLMSGWATLATAQDALDLELTRELRKDAEARLARLEKQEGKKIAWHHADLMLRAEDVANAASAKRDAIDAAKLEAAMVGLETSLAGWTSYVGAHADETKGLADSDGFGRAAQELVNQTHIVLRQAKDPGKGKDDGYAFGQLIKAYNDLIDRSNRM